jgi:glutamate--cysteine ligase
MPSLDSKTIYQPYATSLRMSDLGYTSTVQSNINISVNNLHEYTDNLNSAISASEPAYSDFGLIANGQYQQLSLNKLQIENEYYSTIRPKRVCPTGDRPIDVLEAEGIDYVELRCIDLNPSSFIGITEEQIYFLDLLILYSFFNDSPEITDTESNELFMTHKTVVNEGRMPDAKIKTNAGETSIKEEALRILNGMQEIADFMDNEVLSDGNGVWSNYLSSQIEVAKNLDMSLSGTLLKDIQDQDISFQQYGMHLSHLHKDQMDNTSPKNEHDFTSIANESLEAAKKIENENQIEFEDYLKEFLNKIS